MNSMYVAIRKLIKEKKILGSEERHCFVYDEKTIISKVEDLVTSFPKNSIHCYATKACQFPRILKIMKSKGMGIECASIEEVYHSKNQGFDISKEVVFDSPCKTVVEIKDCLSKDLFLLNIDNLQEIQRVKTCFKLFPKSKTNVGLRINPQMEKGKTGMTSTSTNSSKFGIPIEIGKERIVKEIKGFPQINTLHVHVGSGGMGTNQLVKGVQFVLDLAIYINKEIGESRIQFLDIGGGLPCRQDPKQSPITFKEYWKHLKILNGIDGFRIITEFGRALVHEAGTAISRVEYVKSAGGRQICVIHHGTELLAWGTLTKGKMLEISPIYLNEKAEFKDMKKEAEKRKEFKLKVLDVVGAHCFSGDIVCRKIQSVPSLKQEDIVFLPCVGAYSTACWCKIDSRKIPNVFLLNSSSKLEFLKKKEEMKNNLLFWEP